MVLFQTILSHKEFVRLLATKQNYDIQKYCCRAKWANRSKRTILESTILEDEDVIEIVQFVGGG